MSLTASRLIPSHAVLSAEVPAGEPWMHEIRKGQYFRIVDLHGNQAVDTLFYNAHDYSDRYSAQDTIRAQAQSVSDHRHAADVFGGARASDHRGRYVRPS